MSDMEKAIEQFTNAVGRTPETYDELNKWMQGRGAIIGIQGSASPGTISSAPTPQQSVGTIGGFLSEATLQNYYDQVQNPRRTGRVVPVTPKPVKVKKIKRRQEKVSFDSVVLAPEKKEEIKAAISQMENEEQIFDKWGFGDIFEKGTAVTLLFHGVPGTGKTLMAQAIADDLKAELKVYGTAEIESSEPGGAERAIKKIFITARDFFTANKKPQVILFDECDALLYNRNKVGVILGAQINTLLGEIEKHEGIIIFTTNRIGILDPALERRIAAKIEFPFPDLLQRKAIWERMIPKSAPLGKDVDLERLAVYPLAGGNIKNAVLNAARMAAYKKESKIPMKYFVQAIEREAIAQKAFEAEYQQGHFQPAPITGAGEDYGMTEGNKLTTDLKIDINSNKERKHELG